MKAIGNIDYSPELTTSEKAIVEQSKDTRFADVFLNDKEKTIAGMIRFLRECALDLGHTKPDEKLITHTADNLGLEIINTKEFVNLKVAEVKTAIKSGIRGEYTEKDAYNGLSIVNVHKWLKSFIFDEKRKDAINKQILWESRDLTPVITDEDKKRLEAEFWEREKKNAEKFKRGEPVDIFAPITVMKYYEESGLIKLTKAEKWVEYEKAKKQLIEQMKRQRIGDASRELREKIKRFESGDLNESEKKEISCHACRMVIEYYYKK
jgi:hypothetical protein